MNKIAIVHIGLHKTGSTSIQGVLKKNESNSIAYIPQTFRLEDDNFINHALLAWYFYGDERKYLIKHKIEEFKEEIKNKNLILLSSEDFSLVLSNQKTKKSFEDLLGEFKIIYLVYFRNMKDIDAVLMNEIKKHYKVQKRSKISRYFGTIREFFRLREEGKIFYSMYKSNYKNFFFTSHKKIIREFKSKSKGYFLFFEYNKNIDIFKPLREICIFKNIITDNIYFNRGKMWFVLKFLNLFFTSKIIYIKKNRLVNNTNFLKKSIWNLKNK